MKKTTQNTASALILMSMSALATASVEDGAERSNANLINLARPDASLMLEDAVIVDRYAGYSAGELTLRNTAARTLTVHDVQSQGTMALAPGFSVKLNCAEEGTFAFSLSDVRAYDTVPCDSLVRIRERQFSGLLDHELTVTARRDQQEALDAYLDTARTFYGDDSNINGYVEDFSQSSVGTLSAAQVDDGIRRPSTTVSCCGIAVHGTVFPVYTQDGFVDHVYFVGQNFSGDTKSVENNRATATGTLRSSVWARDTPYDGSDTFSGFRMAVSSSNWGTLSAGGWFADFEDNMNVLPGHPESGDWYVYTLVDEWEDGAWVWVHVTGSSTTQVTLGPVDGSSGGDGSGSSSSGCTVVPGGSNPNNPLFLLLLLGALAYLARVADVRRRTLGKD